MNDDNAIDKIKSNQNRIQSSNYVFNEDVPESQTNFAASGIVEDEEDYGNASGSASTNKKGIDLLRGNKLKKIKILALAIGAFAFIIMIVLFLSMFNDEVMKGMFLSDNSKGSTSSNGSSSSSFVTTSGTKKTNAIVSEFYKSDIIENEAFFSDLKSIANNYENYSLNNGVSLTEGDFDIALISSSIHFNKFISDTNVLSGVINGYRTMSNMGVARSRSLSTLPVYEMKSFYELADISLGTDTGIPDPQMRGLAGNLVGSKVISACVSDKSGYLSNAQITGSTAGGKVTYSVLDSTIIRYETLYYSGASINGYKSDGTQTVRWYTQQLKLKLDNLNSNGTFDDYYDTSQFNENMDCGDKYLVHYVVKYMNYKTFAKYLLNEYIPENYIECIDCNSNNKKANTISIAESIFANRNQFASVYYGNVIDTINFGDGTLVTDSSIEYQLPDEVKQKFISPLALNSECMVSSPFTTNRNGYSHLAVDTYVSSGSKNINAVYDGVVTYVLKDVPNIYSQWNGGACVDSNGNKDSRSGGNYVVVKHEINGTVYYSQYMHLETISVSVGDKVTRGQVLGTEGNSGCSSGYHLHFQLISVDSSGSKRYDPTLLFAQCSGVNIVSYDSESLMEYLNSIYPNYNYTYSNKCVVKVRTGDGADSGPYASMDLETYVAGVVSHEMPDSYNFEALKAQAIAGRNEYIHRTKYCTTDEIVPNSTSFQTHSQIDTINNKTDIVNMLAARETAGMLISYANGLHFTEYANFPCEIVYSCDNANYKPYYNTSSNSITCVPVEGYFGPDNGSKVITTGNTNGFSSACNGSKGSVYYCGSTNVPRQFRTQDSKVAGIVGDCSTLSVNLLPHNNANSTYRTMPVSVGLLKEGSTMVNHTSNPSEDYSTFTGHNRGMSQVLANIYANLYGWNYEQIINYFYNQTETSQYDLIKITTPSSLLDDQTEYEANYSDGFIGKVTLSITNSIKITVPVDFYVAGVLEYNFANGTSSNLLKAMAVSSRTWALNTSKWGEETLNVSGQYSFTYSDSKEIYDAVNATKEEVIVDSEGYITPTEYTYVGNNGTIKESNGKKTITYELGYMYNDDTHKVTIDYDEYFDEVISGVGNVGVVYNVASYLANNWYFMDHYELLQFFYGEDFNVKSYRDLNTINAIKDKNGSVVGTPTSYSALASAVNSSLEDYVAQNGKGTLKGVLAAAYWLYLHSNEVKDVSLPYQLGGEWQSVGVNPQWGQTVNDKKIGLDCVGYIRWAFINGYFSFPKGSASGTNNNLFVYSKMTSYIDKNKLTCGENGESCYYKLTDNPTRGASFAEYVENGLLKEGDIVFHPSEIVYAGESEKQQYSHIGIVYKVDLESRTIVVLHCSGGDPGIKYSTINIDTGKYESGNKHSFTTVIRMSEMEERGYLE